jgi:hypothetical protein
LIYQSFNYILQRYPPDTSRHHPDNLPTFPKILEALGKILQRIDAIIWGFVDHHYDQGFD